MNLSLTSLSEDIRDLYFKTGIKDIEENYIEIDGKKVNKATVKEALKQFINKL